MNSADALANLFPAIRATAPAPHLTSRYVFVDTAQMISALDAEGFAPHSPSLLYRRRARANESSLYGRHMIEFRPKTQTLRANVAGDVVPRIIFANSHNGSTRAWVRAGLFRVVCSNGMVVSRLDTGSVVARHAGNTARELIHRAQQIARNTAPLFEKIERWSATPLSRGDAHQFARLAATLRWGDPHRVSSDELLRPRRDTDAGDDLWRVFNRVQEATTSLRLEALSRNGRALQTQPLAEPFSNTLFNEQLWELAEEFAEA